MSIEQTEIVDFVNSDRETGDLWLTISDHLEWDRNSGEHLVLLQNQLNAYFRFIESGETKSNVGVPRNRPERRRDTWGRQTGISWWHANAFDSSSNYTRTLKTKCPLSRQSP